MSLILCTYQMFRGRQIKVLGAIALLICCMTLFMSSVKFPIGNFVALNRSKGWSIDLRALSRDLMAAESRCIRNNCGYGSHHLVLYTSKSEPLKRRVINRPNENLQTIHLEERRKTSIYEQVARYVYNASPRTQPYSVFFSFATNAHRLPAANCPLRYWAQDSKVHILLTVPQDDRPDAESIAKEFFGDLGLTSFHVQRATADAYPDVWSSNLPTMVKIAAEQGLDITHYVLLDDDTYVALDSFRHILDEHDPDIPRVIGAPSERVAMVATEGAGQGAYGGAGVILTRALAKQVSAAWDKTDVLRHGNTFDAGDAMLTGAISYVQNRPSRSPNIYYELDLHQLDIGDLASSVFKSGWRFVTIHHWSWFDMFPVSSKLAQLQITDALFKLLGAENLFTNYLLTQNERETVILTSGYCITSYDPPLTELELYLTEAAPGAPHWHHLAQWEGTHGPWRPERVEGHNKTTQWLTSIEPRRSGANVYYMTFETVIQGLDGRGTSVAWVVS